MGEEVPNKTESHSPSQEDLSIKTQPLTNSEEDLSNKTEPLPNSEEELSNKTQPQPNSVSQEKESEKPDPPNQNVTSPSPLLQTSSLIFTRNRAYKKHSAIGLWEDSKKASVEAQLKKIEEDLEKKKAEYVEKMKNKVAEIHRLAEEKRAIVEAQRREEFLDLEETAGKFRSRGNTPRRFFSCLSG
uniref:Remorin n=1 Tax=Cajanus cajan TaxID=3821 RepID=A0A151TJS5_CAJCA|nr:Remorin [Cajanus cajan]